MATLPMMPENWEPTRGTLHAYAHAVSALPRIHAPAHPRWWHISLKVRPDGLVTESFTIPAGGTAFVRMDLRSHEIVFETSTGQRRAFPMNAGLTATEMGEALIAAASEFGLGGDYARDKFESDEPRVYEPTDATAFFAALVVVDQVLSKHRNRLGGEVGPIQLWPHGFDLAFEWFGTKTTPHEENGRVEELPSQINLGFYPAGDAYFYSNPWPFDSNQLLGVALPAGAEWHTEGWEGSTFSYDSLAGTEGGEERLLAYASAVFDAASPLLTK